MNNNDLNLVKYKINNNISFKNKKNDKLYSEK